MTNLEGDQVDLEITTLESWSARGEQAIIPSIAEEPEVIWLRLSNIWEDYIKSNTSDLFWIKQKTPEGTIWNLQKPEVG